MSQPTTNALKWAAVPVTVALLMGWVSSRLATQQAAIAAALDAGVTYVQPAPLDQLALGHALPGSYHLGSTTLVAPRIQNAALGRITTQPIYVLGDVCAVPIADDGGLTDPGQYVIDGIVVVYDDDTTRPCDSSMDPALHVWTQDTDGGAPWACACASGTGPACFWTHLARTAAFSYATVTGAAPPGITLGAGTWAGDGCVPKPCVEVSGVSSWPSACPAR